MQLGKVSNANVVDHIKPHRGNMNLFWDVRNWQSVCKKCHDRHKQKQEKSGIMAGADLDGVPMDEKHHWNQ